MDEREGSTDIDAVYWYERGSEMWLKPRSFPPRNTGGVTMSEGRLS